MGGLDFFFLFLLFALNTPEIWENMILFISGKVINQGVLDKIRGVDTDFQP